MLKLKVGVCRKVGQPNYGSLGASCEVDIELAEGLLFEDPETFQSDVRQAYAACERAVDEQLGAAQQPLESNHAPGPRHLPSSNGSNHGQGGSNHGPYNGNGSSGRQASEKQLAYLQQLAAQIEGLGVRNLETVAQTMFGKPVAGLSSIDASGLIDTLKAIKAGEIDLDAALNGAAA